MPASLTPVTNTSPLSAVVVISGGTMTNVSVNGVTVGAGAGTYTVPAGQAITFDLHGRADVDVVAANSVRVPGVPARGAFTGTDVTVKLQDLRTT